MRPRRLRTNGRPGQGEEHAGAGEDDPADEGSPGRGVHVDRHVLAGPRVDVERGAVAHAGAGDAVRAREGELRVAGGRAGEGPRAAARVSRVARGRWGDRTRCGRWPSGRRRAPPPLRPAACCRAVAQRSIGRSTRTHGMIAFCSRRELEGGVVVRDRLDERPADHAAPFKVDRRPLPVGAAYAGPRRHRHGGVGGRRRGTGPAGSARTAPAAPGRLSGPRMGLDRDEERSDEDRGKELACSHGGARTLHDLGQGRNGGRSRPLASPVALRLLAMGR